MTVTITEQGNIHTGQIGATSQPRKKARRRSALLYRLPLPVTKVLVLRYRDSYPICLRCDCTVDREYMRYCDRCGKHLSWELFGYAKAIHTPRKPK